MYYLFLDDERNPRQVTWVRLPYANYQIVRSYTEFVNYIKSFGVPEFVTFDHDLADQHYGHGLNDDEIPYNRYSEKTGYDCAKWLVDYCIDNKVKFPDYMIHSMNPVGSKNIISYIEKAKRNASI